MSRWKRPRVEFEIAQEYADEGRKIADYQRDRIGDGAGDCLRDVYDLGHAERESVRSTG